MTDVEARPDGCMFRVLSAAGSSLVLGGIVGAVSATWAVRSPPRFSTRRSAPGTEADAGRCAGCAEGAEGPGCACPDGYRARDGRVWRNLRRRRQRLRRGRCAAHDPMRRRQGVKNMLFLRTPRPPRSACPRAPAAPRICGTACTVAQLPARRLVCAVGALCDSPARRRARAATCCHAAHGPLMPPALSQWARLRWVWARPSHWPPCPRWWIPPATTCAVRDQFCGVACKQTINYFYFLPSCRAGNGAFEDGATPPRIHFPAFMQTAYSSKASSTPTVRPCCRSVPAFTRGASRGAQPSDGRLASRDELVCPTLSCRFGRRC